MQSIDKLMKFLIYSLDLLRNVVLIEQNSLPGAVGSWILINQCLKMMLQILLFLGLYLQCVWFLKNQPIFLCRSGFGCCWKEGGAVFIAWKGTSPELPGLDLVLLGKSYFTLVLFFPSSMASAALIHTPWICRSLTWAFLVSAGVTLANSNEISWSLNLRISFAK